MERHLVSSASGVTFTSFQSTPLVNQKLSALVFLPCFVVEMWVHQLNKPFPSVGGHRFDEPETRNDKYPRHACACQTLPVPSLKELQVECTETPRESSWSSPEVLLFACPYVAVVDARSLAQGRLILRFLGSWLRPPGKESILYFRGSLRSGNLSG